MLDNNIKTRAAFMALPFDEAKKTWIERARLESGRVASARQWMEANGFEIVQGRPENIFITPDGREILHEHRRQWALRPEVHTARLAASFEYAAAKKGIDPAESETKSVVGSESLSTIACPKCGDTLQHTAVCPKCAAGRLGYRHRYACVCGTVDLISKEKL